MSEYQRAALDPTYAPLTSIDNWSKLKEFNAQKDSEMRDYITQRRQNEQYRIEDTKFVGQDLEALSQFSATALKFAEEKFKQGFKDQETNAWVDDVLDNPLPDPTQPVTTESMAEDSAIAAGNNANSQVGPAVAELNKAGRPILAATLAQSNKIGRGVTNERVLLQDSKGYLMSRVPAILNDANEMVDLGDGQGPQSITKLALDPANSYTLTKYAIRKALLERKLQFTTKRNFKEILGGTIENLVSNYSSNLVTKAIKGQQDDDKLTLTQNATAWGFASRGKTKDELQLAFDSVLQNSQSLNTGMTQGQQNQMVITSMIAGLGKDGKAIAQLALVDIKKGATVGQTFPTLIEQSIQNANKLQKAEDTALADEIGKKGYDKLQQLRAEGASIEELKRASLELQTQMGGYDLTTAQAYGNRYDALIINPIQETVFKDARTQIYGGKNYSEVQLQSMGLEIAQINNLMSIQSDTQTINKISSVTSTLDSTLKGSVFLGAGIKVDPTTQYVISQNWLDSSVATNALNAFSQARQKHLREFATSLRGLPEQEQIDKLTAEARSFDATELGVGGKFRALGTLRDLSSKPQTLTPELESTIQDSLRDYASPNAVYSVRPTRAAPKNFTTSVKYGQPIPPGIISQYKQQTGVQGFNTKVLTYNETVNAVSTAKQTGVIPAEIVTMSESLGLPATTFLNQQASAYAVPGYTPTAPTAGAAKPKVPGFTNIQPGPDLSSAEQRQIKPQVQQVLVSYGLSSNASLALSRVFALYPVSEWQGIINAFKQYPPLEKAVKSPTATPRTVARHFAKFRSTYMP